MSTRMPPRGRGPQRPPMKPAVIREESKVPSAAPDEQRKRFPFVIILVVAALAVLYMAVGNPTTQVNMPGATLNLGGKTAKPSSTSPGATAAPVNVTNLPRITEVMTSNSGTVTAEDGQYYDWIEIYNPTNQKINLQGFAVSDNLKKPRKFVLPSYSLEPGKYALIYASDMISTSTEIHASFKMKASGTPLTLVDPNGREIQTIACPQMQTNSSYALDMNSQAWAVTDKSTPGFPNTNEGYAAYMETRHATSPVTINEVMAGNTLTFKDGDGDYSDWVEIYNGSDKEMDLTGWGLSNRESETKRWVFPAMKLAPKEYKVVFVSGKNRTDPTKDLHANFRLNGFKDIVLLSNLRGQIVSEISINNLKADTSFGAVPGSDKWQVFVHPTPGYPNNEEGWNALQPKLYDNNTGDVIISEVMSNNVSELKDQFDEYPDWIELYNRSGKSISLKGWGLTDKTNELGRWKFPDVSIEPGKYMTVFASGKNLTDANAISKKKLHTDFNIGSSGCVVVLTKPDGSISDKCFAPALRNSVTYGRPASDITSTMAFQYITDPTPGAANPNGYPGFTPDPVFSLNAGQYEKAQKVSLSVDDPKAKVFFTKDSTTPTQNKTPYTAAIDLLKTTAIRAIAYRDGYLPSNAVCSTYLIGENISLPVVSIVTDPGNLYDEQTGIYVKGTGSTPNYKKDWERPAHIELLENDGTVGFSQDIGIKIFGAQSRNNDQKSFALMARSIYGKSGFDYAVFPELPFTSYKDLVIRNSAQDALLSRIRDSVQISLAQETSSENVDTQAHRQSILFINGEFFGVYDLMEKVNTHMLAQHHNLDPNKIDLLVANGTIVNGSNTEYKALVQYAKDHDLSKKEYYDYVANKVDIDSLIDWYTIEAYTGNTDLGNIKFWKPQTPDGKWRWILYDMDYGFFYADQKDTYRTDTFRDFLSSALNPNGNGIGDHFSTVLINALLKNEEFKQKFIKRYVYHCTVTFETNRSIARINEMQANIAPYMERDKERFPKNAGNLTTWNKQVEILRTFAKIRPEMNLHYMQQYFHLTDAQMNTLLNK